ncbi:MAG: diguanylate cyclase response regulator [Stappia sp.]|uniref:diguanylate cyclase domain-containing protein n=1 Tax=Stappia sp. TaxID=1870903 RepID=UPI000C5382B1|nr:diguanylate cyclase [Stappia sp.]MAB00201.1 diguanylate cyclase response regulator [Stappia sp.]MBM21073.1 diguanylate cyclase response regulator [Stappia sp.]
MSQVLLVEDTAFFERVIRRQLSELPGLTVLSAASHEEARELLARPDVNPVLALVDLTLPDAPDGEIVDLVLAADLPTIVFSGRFDERMRHTLLAKGVVDYILKENPASLTYLTSLVKRIYRNREVDALVVDDSKVDAEVIVRRLRRYRLRVHVANGFEAALAHIEATENLRLVILDYVMPKVDGFSLLQTLRRRFAPEDLAVVGLSGHAEPGAVARFLKSGANDFMMKSCSPEEFMLRISQNLDMLDRLDDLSRMAHRDELTGLSNRRHLFSQGRVLYDQTRRAGSQIAVAALDLDMLKAVNDRHGHERGDALIRAFGELLARMAPAGAFPARLGGDEFCVILPEIGPRERHAFVRSVVEALPGLGHPGGGLEDIGPITMSAGVSNGTESSLDEALRKADARLYEAKNAGRNRMVGFGEETSRVLVNTN